MAEERGLLSRWSDRKRAVAKEETEASVEPAKTPQPEQEADEEADANRAAAEAIDLDALGYDSDFSVFFKRGVPAALQSAARRKLWRSSPVLANLDQMNEYDEDFASKKLILKSFKSAWQVGRGYLDKVEEALGDEEVIAAAPEPPSDAVVPPGARKDAAAPIDEERSEVAENQREASSDAPADEPPDAAEDAEEENRRLPLRARLDLDAFGKEEG